MKRKKSASTDKRVSAIVETLLLAHGEPITLAKLAKASGFSLAEIAEAITALTRMYTDRGFAILEKDGEVGLGTNPAYAEYAENLLREEFTESLSRAALETLAIIAYKGPIARASIDFIRGVNSSFIVRNLAMRGLIEHVENHADGRAYLWRVSFDFLKHIGITRIEDLPEFTALHKKEIAIPEERPPVEVPSHTPEIPPATPKIDL